ncbi:WD40 repeat protein Ciao1 [Tremella mesenterica]|uniref:Probable cytosolic iron-sulfur protein assembly protein 1 n=1 Tax=Tremella mesenterica TaxID=5217 RepID=A0A4Q1BHZ7_TREME|nr:WD40 repeat protein Ciao1 [Tremella mesenterica]
MPSIQLVADLPGHTSPAWCITFNPTRPLFATCSTDKTIRMYSYSLPAPSSTSTSSHSQPHLPPITKLSSQTSISESESQSQISYHLPNLESPKPQINLVSEISSGHSRTVRWISWAPSGNTFASASFDSTVKIWEEIGDDDDDDVEEEEFSGVYRNKLNDDVDVDMEDLDGQGDEEDVGEMGEEEEKDKKEWKEWECVTTLEGHESECKNVGFSHDGGLLASCSRDKSVWVWEVQPDDDFECIAVMMEHNQDVKCLAWHPKEEILASASYDSTIHLMFDDPDGDWCPFQKLYPKLSAAPLFLSLPTPANLPNTSANYLNTSSPPSQDLNTTTSESDKTSTPSGQSSINGQTQLDHSPLSALYPTEEEKAAAALHIPPLLEDETVWCLSWSPCGKYLASGGDRGGIRIWTRNGSNPDSQLIETLHTSAHSSPCFSLSWGMASKDDSNNLGLLISAGGDGRIIIRQITKSTRSSQNISSVDQDTSRQSGISMNPICAIKDAHGVSDVNCVAWCDRQDGRGKGMFGSVGDDGGVKIWRVVR